MNKIIALAGLLALLFCASCGTKEKEVTETTTFKVTTPFRHDTVVMKNYVCQIRAVQHIELRALEKGYVEKVYVDEGQSVRKGQPMFKTMAAIYSAEVQIAKAETEFAQVEYNNTKLLADKNVVSANELALAKAKLEKAKAQQVLAETHLGFTDIKAPFNGIMDHLNVRVGSLVDDGDLLTSISDNSEMWVYFNVPEAEYLDYKMRLSNDNLLKVNLTMANNLRFPYPGVVKAIEADFNNETGNIAFRATFPNPKGLLRHGETGNVLVETPAPNALLIPQKATFEVLDKKYVYVITKDNVVESRAIVIGGELPHIFIVKRGLKETDTILLEGLRQVKENDKIKTAMQNPKTVLKSLELYAE